MVATHRKNNAVCHHMLSGKRSSSMCMTDLGIGWWLLWIWVTNPSSVSVPVFESYEPNTTSQPVGWLLVNAGRLGFLESHVILWFSIGGYAFSKINTINHPLIICWTLSAIILVGSQSIDSKAIPPKHYSNWKVDGPVPTYWFIGTLY